MAGPQQNFSDRYGAVISLKSASVFAPGRDVSTADLTAGASVMVGAGSCIVGTPLGYAQTGNSVTTAASLPSIPAGASIAVIQAEATPFRWRDDGTDPTISTGMTLLVGATLTYTGNLALLRFIPVSVGGVVDVAYYG